MVLGMPENLSHVLVSFFHILCRERVRYLTVRVCHCVKRNDDPQTVEEDQVYPHVHEVASIKVHTARQPLGTERHET